MKLSLRVRLLLIKEQELIASHFMKVLIESLSESLEYNTSNLQFM